MIQYNALPIPSARHRSPSPPPIYDPDTGERTNTREDRVKTKVGIGAGRALPWPCVCSPCRPTGCTRHPRRTACAWPFVADRVREEAVALRVVVLRPRAAQPPQRHSPADQGRHPLHPRQGPPGVQLHRHDPGASWQHAEAPGARDGGQGHGARQGVAEGRAVAAAAARGRAAARRVERGAARARVRGGVGPGRPGDDGDRAPADARARGHERAQAAAAHATGQDQRHVGRGPRLRGHPQLPRPHHVRPQPRGRRGHGGRLPPPHPDPAACPG